MFRDLILELSTTHHVIAPDYPGFGNSSVPARSQGPYTFDALADTVGKFIDKVGIGRFALYATDFGGLVGYRLMLNVPHRMTALIAQNNPLFLAESPWFSALFPYWNEETEENRSKVKAHYLTLDVIRDLYLTGVRDETLIDPTLWQVDYQSLQRTGAADISLDLLLDIRSNGPILERAQDYLRTHQPPTLVVSGKNDILFTEQNQQRYREILPDVEMHLTDSGHCALVDKSKEISQTVHEFLVRRL
jgi:pimeloyl-ACP methyl ester carboxylesterase